MKQIFRKFLLKRLTGEREILLTRSIPSRERLCSNLTRMDALGIYLEPAPKSRFLALLRRNVATHLPRI